MFQPILRYFTKNANSGVTSAWKSKEWPDECFKVSAAYISIVLSLDCINTKIQVKFDGSCFKQKKFTFTHKKVVNSYTVY